MTAVDERPAPVQAVRRTMEALELISDKPGGVTVLDVAEGIGVSKSIASRILASLVEQGYLVRDPSSGEHELAIRLYALAQRSSTRIGFPDVCQSVLQALTDATGEVAQMSVAAGDELILVAHSRVQHRLQVMPVVGMVHLPHATSSGKVWLASMTDEIAAEIALRAGLPQRTSRTISSLADLLAELARVRERGYATVEDEFEDGVSAIAAPIGQKRFGRVAGTVALSAPSSRVGRDELDALAPALLRAAEDLEVLWPLAAGRARVAA